MDPLHGFLYVLLYFPIHYRLPLHHFLNLKLHTFAFVFSIYIALTQRRIKRKIRFGTVSIISEWSVLLKK